MLKAIACRYLKRAACISVLYPVGSRHGPWRRWLGHAWGSAVYLLRLCCWMVTFPACCSRTFPLKCQTWSRCVCGALAVDVSEIKKYIISVSLLLLCDVKSFWWMALQGKIKYSPATSLFLPFWVLYCTIMHFVWRKCLIFVFLFCLTLYRVNAVKSFDLNQSNLLVESDAETWICPEVVSLTGIVRLQVLKHKKYFHVLIMCKAV